MPERPAAAPRDPVQRWRIVFRRRADAPPLVQRDASTLWEQAILASGLPVQTTDGDPPRPRLTFGAPLPVGMAAERELADLVVTDRLPVWRVREALADCLPAGHELVDVHDVWLGEAALPALVVASDVVVTLEAASPAGAPLGDAVTAMLAAGSLPRRRAKGDRAVEYDLRPLLIDLGVVDESGAPAVRMRLRHDPQRGVGRPDEVLAELSERSGAELTPGRTVRACLLLAEDLPAAQRLLVQPEATVSTRRPRK